MTPPEPHAHTQDGSDDNHNPPNKNDPANQFGFWTSPNHWIAIATVVIAVANGFYTFFALQQWHTMQNTLTEMKRSGQSAADQIWRAVDNLNWLAKEMMNANSVSKSNADTISRNASRALTASIENMRLEQRAWMGVIDVRANGSQFESGAFSVGSVDIVIYNSGRTPAINVSDMVYTVTSQSRSEPIPDYDAITAEIARRFGNIPAVASRGNPTVRLGGILPQGVPRTITIAAGGTRFGTNERGYIVGKFTYRDIFGDTPSHTTKFCVMQTDDNRGMAICPDGNLMN